MSGQSANITQTICNALWGHQLSFHPFSRGDPLVKFSSLWPDNNSLIDAYRDANLEQAPYELCKLLLATNSASVLDALLEEHVLLITRNFSPGCVTLAHLACALRANEVMQVLSKRSQSNNGIWSMKDDEEHVPIDVCFETALRRYLPNRPFFSKKKVPQGLPLKDTDKNRIFGLAKNPDNFYHVIVQLQMYTFDVNHVRNADGDLLIHVAIQGGLSQLPLLYALVVIFKASIAIPDSTNLTPLCLACMKGEEKLAEVLICVMGADLNASSNPKKQTPLHCAVLHDHPKVVSMLLRRGADSSSEDKRGCLPSFVARKNRFHECQQIIIQFQRERISRLAQEATGGTLDVSRLYLADSSIVTNSGCTLLMLATMNDRESTVMELSHMEHCPLDFKQMKSCDIFDSDSVCVSEGSWMVDDSEHSLKTAVHMAAEKGYNGCLQALLEAGAHPSIPDAASFLPLHYACDNGWYDCVDTIVSYPNQLGLSGLRPALNISKGCGNTKIIELLEKAVIRRQNELVTPLLFEVAYSGNKDLLFAVLENGDDVNPINEAHDWPLILAAGFGYYDLVTHLHEFGGHVIRAHQVSKSTPLHVAARGGHKEVVRYLLQFCTKPSSSLQLSPSPLPSGANLDDHLDVNTRNAARATPLELAVSQGSLDVVRLLIESGASTTLPDSNGCLLNCKSFAGTQFLIETHRKEKKRKIMSCLQKKALLNDFKKVWRSPSDFNLCQTNGDSLIMTAAQFGKPDVLEFLIDSARKCTQEMLITPGQPMVLSRINTSSNEESSDVLENSLPKNFKPSLPKFPQSALSSVLPRNLQSHGQKAEVTVTSLGPMRLFNKSNHNDGSDEEERRMLETRSALPSVVRTQFRDEKGQTDNQRSSRRKQQQRQKPIQPYRELDSGHESRGEDEGSVFTRLMYHTNPGDGRTALHRAAEAGQHENVSVLLNTEEDLANMQDFNGNTALHVACLKAHKQTVKVLLSFNCVDTLVRNAGNELPEERCVRRDIRKQVSKVRQLKFGSIVPDQSMSNGSPQPPKGMASVGTVDPSNPPLAESPAPSTISDLTVPEFQIRFNELKMEFGNEH